MSLVVELRRSFPFTVKLRVDIRYLLHNKTMILVALRGSVHLYITSRNR